MHLTVVSSVCLKKFTWKQSTSGRSRSYTIIWVARQDLRHSTTFGGPRMLDRIIWVKLGWVVQGLLFVFFGGFQYPPLKQAWNEHLKHQPFLWIGQPVYSSCQSEWTKVDWISFQTLVTCHTHTHTDTRNGWEVPPPPPIFQVSQIGEFLFGPHSILIPIVQVASDIWCEQFCVSSHFFAFDSCASLVVYVQGGVIGGDL